MRSPCAFCELGQICLVMRVIQEISDSYTLDTLQKYLEVSEFQFRSTVKFLWMKAELGKPGYHEVTTIPLNEEAAKR